MKEEHINDKAAREICEAGASLTPEYPLISDTLHNISLAVTARQSPYAAFLYLWKAMEQLKRAIDIESNRALEKDRLTKKLDPKGDTIYNCLVQISKSLEGEYPNAGAGILSLAIALRYNKPDQIKDGFASVGRFFLQAAKDLEQ